MFKLEISTPDRDNALGWLDSRDVSGEQLDEIVRTTALDGERFVKEILHAETKEATGLTAASVETWLVYSSPTVVQYAVGSRSRGHVLRWLDRGRGYVYPVRATALSIKQGRVSPPIFRAWARPSPALNLMFRAASQALSNMEENVRKVMNT